jgi:hypothetical protein
MKKPRKTTIEPTTIKDSDGTSTSDRLLVEIRPLRIKRTRVTIQGTSPLIMHAWSQKAIDMIANKQGKKATGPKEAKIPKDEFNLARYRIDENTDGIPTVAIKSCAVEAGVALGVFKTTLRKAFFVCPDGEELVPIKCKPRSSGDPAAVITSSGAMMRRDMVKVGMGTADVRYRPEYKDWSCTFPVEYNEDLLSAEILFNLFNVAGYSIGLGEWRPERNGLYGRFKVAVE